MAPVASSSDGEKKRNGISARLQTAGSVLMRLDLPVLHPCRRSARKLILLRQWHTPLPYVRDFPTHDFSNSNAQQSTRRSCLMRPSLVHYCLPGRWTENQSNGEQPVPCTGGNDFGQGIDVIDRNLQRHRISAIPCSYSTGSRIITKSARVPMSSAEYIPAQPSPSTQVVWQSQRKNY